MPEFDSLDLLIAAISEAAKAGKCLPTLQKAAAQAPAFNFDAEEVPHFRAEVESLIELLHNGTVNLAGFPMRVACNHQRFGSLFPVNENQQVPTLDLVVRILDAMHAKCALAICRGSGIGLYAE